jgi:hypothetical protein
MTAQGVIIAKSDNLEGSKINAVKVANLYKSYRIWDKLAL